MDAPSNQLSIPKQNNNYKTKIVEDGPAHTQFTSILPNLHESTEAIRVENQNNLITGTYYYTNSMLHSFSYTEICDNSLFSRIHERIVLDFYQ